METPPTGSLIMHYWMTFRSPAATSLLLKAPPFPGPNLITLSSLQPLSDTASNTAIVRADGNVSVEFDDSLGNTDGVKEFGSRKRMRSGNCSASDSKAYKEKIRRDMLNDRFQELSSILEPERPPKMDKAVILSDAVRMVIQMQEEVQKLKESNESLQEKLNELKAEKNELRDEKLKLKTERDKLELQVKALNTPRGFLPQPHPIPVPFAASPPVVGSKLVPLVGYPGIPMWRFVPPTAVETSEDDALPPVA